MKKHNFFISYGISAHDAEHIHEYKESGIAYGADDILNGNSKMIIRFDDNDISVTLLFNFSFSCELFRTNCGSEKSKIKTAFFICLFTHLSQSLNKMCIRDRGYRQGYRP